MPTAFQPSVMYSSAKPRRSKAGRSAWSARVTLAVCQACCGSADADLGRPAPDALAEEGIALAWLLADDVMELPEQLKRHGSEQSRPQHQAGLQHDVGQLGRDGSPDRRQCRPARPADLGAAWLWHLDPACCRVHEDLDQQHCDPACG